MVCEKTKMQLRILIILLCLVTMLSVVLSIAKDRDTQNDGPIQGSGGITKLGGKVRAFADASAQSWVGWYWIHARVLPYGNNPTYSQQKSNPISGYVYVSVKARRTGQKSNGRAYCSMWAQSSQGYHSVLIDLP